MRNPSGQAGASDRLARRSNEATSLEQAEPQRLDPIVVFAPWAAEGEKALRRRIHRAQGAATARATRSRHGRARQIYWLAAALASDWTFQRAPITDLSEILAALARLFLTAGVIERLEAPDER